jgi:DNA-directed RNA polymerase specialized sigma24 family protein
MKDLYQATTGDTTAHQRRIDGQVRHLSQRRQVILRRRIDGQSLAEIGKYLEISHGSVASSIKKSMEAIRKAIAGEPRFNHIGHPGARSRAKGKGDQGRA